MNLGIIIQFRVKGIGKLAVVTDTDDFIVNYRKHFHIRRGFRYVRGTDEGHWYFSDPFYFRFCMKTAKLPAIGVSSYIYRQCGKMRGFLTFDFGCMHRQLLRSLPAPVW